MPEDQEKPIEQPTDIPDFSTEADKVMPAIRQDVTSIFSQSINMNEKGIYHEVGCPLCSHPARQDLEDIWENSDEETKRKIEIINETSRNDSGLTFSSDIIKHHMISHLNQGAKQHRMREYAEEISRLNQTSMTTIGYLQTCISMVFERIARVNSLVPNNDISESEIEKLKATEGGRLFKNLTDLLKLRASILGEMKNSGELVSIPRDYFVTVFNEAKAEANTDAEKDLIDGILTKLSTIAVQ